MTHVDNIQQNPNIPRVCHRSGEAPSDSVTAELHNKHQMYSGSCERRTFEGTEMPSMYNISYIMLLSRLYIKI